MPQGYQSILGLYTSMKMGVVRIPEGDKFMKHELMVNAIHRALHEKKGKKSMLGGRQPDALKEPFYSQYTSYQDCHIVQTDDKVCESNKIGSGIFGFEIRKEVSMKYSHLF